MSLSVAQEAYSLVEEDAVQEAEEEGLIRWMPPTMIDPGCYDYDIDVVVDDLLYDQDSDTYQAEASAYVGQTQVFRRDYTFYYVGAYLQRDYEDLG